MAEATPRTRSQSHNHTFQRSTSPSGRFCASSMSSSSSPALSSHRSAAASLFHRPTSPTRVNLSKFVPSSASSSIRFYIDRRPTSSGHQVVRKQVPHQNQLHQKKTCMCSPTTHPGSFRCSLHKNASGDSNRNQNQASSYQPHRLHMRRSAMTNSLVRIGTVEGEWLERALASLIRPSSHQQRRRADFHPKPSRLSIMSKAEDL